MYTVHSDTTYLLLSNKVVQGPLKPRTLLEVVISLSVFININKVDMGMDMGIGIGGTTSLGYAQRIPFRSESHRTHVAHCDFDRALGM